MSDEGKALPEGHHGRMLVELRIFLYTAQQIVVGNRRIKVMDVMNADISLCPEAPQLERKGQDIV